MKKTKVCTKCKKELPATNEYFSKASKGKYGLRADCKKCYSVYRKEHYNNNKDEIRKKQNEYLKLYHKENKERISEYKKEYYHRNKEDINMKQKIYQTKNKEKIREYKKIYKKTNRDVFNYYKQKRRAIMKGLPHTLSVEEWGDIKNQFNYCCAYCGKETDLQQEHFVPLSKGGEYTKNNIIPACVNCNSSKCDNDFFEWYPDHESYSKIREKKILGFLNYKSDKTQQTSAL